MVLFSARDEECDSTETDLEADLEMGRVQAAVDETEAVKKTKAELSPPSQCASKMKIISYEEFRGIVDKFEEPNTTWQSVVADLDTVCIQDEYSKRTLLHCLAGNSRGLTAYLLAEGVPANAKCSRAESALNMAAGCGDIVECKLLSDYGADINVDNHTDPSPMSAAKDRGHIEVVGWLITHPTYKREWNNGLFKHLCGYIPQLVVPYLNVFAVTMAPQTYQHLAELNEASVADFSSRSGVNYHQLKEIYGLPEWAVEDTALSLVIKTPVAREAIGCKAMRHIIKAKWMAFGKSLFRQEFFLYTALVVAFSVSIVCNQVTMPWNRFNGSRQHVVGISRILAAIFSAVLLVRVERREAIVEGPVYFLSFWNLLGAGSYSGIILVVMYQASGAQSEFLQVATGVLNIMLWVNMFQYLQMTEQFAVLVAMMSYMVRDVAKFILLYTMFLFGFSGGFYVLLFGSSGYETFVDSLITVQLMLFGQIVYEPFGKVAGLTRIVSNLLLLVYLVSVVIVLLNLLIAMMSTSYSHVWDEAESQVLLSYAQIIVRMEQSLTKEDRDKQFNTLTTDKERLKSEKWRARRIAGRFYDFYMERQAEKARLVKACFPRWLMAQAIYLLRHLLLVLLHSKAAQSPQESVSPLPWDAISGCSTLEDGERWEIELMQTDSNNRQVAFDTRVDKLTSLVETLIREPSTDKSCDQQAVLNLRVDTLTSLVKEQTALINEQGAFMRAYVAQRAADETTTAK